MTVTKSGNIEYISEVFKELSPERKDYLLDTARSLLNVQDDKIPTISETISQNVQKKYSKTMSTCIEKNMKE
ncbi:MAG: hypothetical protein FWD47_12640 [Treponema sp.]|nr:hypothetical protein [Treponema sp.]